MPKINCPNCEGNGWYTWVDSGYGTDRYYKEDCRQCNKTGKINIQVPVKVFKKYNVETWAELQNLKNIYQKTLEETSKKLLDIESHIKTKNKKD